jgi:uncharacterized membrane protein
MRRILIFCFTLLIVAGLPTSTKAADLSSEQPVVHTVLFWSNGCPFCTQVLTELLPPLQEKYDAQLSVLLIELVSLKEIDKLYDLGAALGLSKERVTVPFLLIDHTALIGADEIKSRLSSLVEEYLAAGGLAYPDIPQLSGMLPDGIAFTSFDPSLLLASQTTVDSKATGMALAWGVMAIMGIALILAISAILRAFQGKPLSNVKKWLDYAIPVLSIVGLGASIYLLYVEITQARALCGPVGDCNAVQSSPYAKLFGIFPIGLLGALGYVAIIITWLWRRFRSDALSRIAGPAMFGMALFGTLFSIYLTYLELFVIHAVCIWCLSSAVIITILMLLNLPPITQWLAISDEEE